MRKHAGQAVRGVLLLTRRLLSLLLALTVVTLLGLIALSWRLSNGPIAMPWLIRQLEAAVNTDPAGPHWTIGTAELAWEGFSGGLDRPLDIRVTGITVASPDGRPLARLPEARVSLAPRELLRGRTVPRTIEMRGAELHAHRTEAAGITLDFGAPDPTAPDVGKSDLGAPNPNPDAPPALTAEDVLAALLGPVTPGQDGILSQLRRIVLREARFTLRDEPNAATWTADHITLDLRRSAEGGAEADLTLDLPLASQTLRLAGRATLRPQADALLVTVRATPVNPARLAAEVPLFVRGAPVDADVTAELNLAFGRTLEFRHADARLGLGPGRLAAGRGTLAIRAAAATVHGDRTGATLSKVELDVPAPSGATTRITGSGSVEFTPGGYDAALAIGLDSITLPDLGLLWPDGVAGPGTRPWIARNLTAGRAHDLRAELGLHATADLGTVKVTRLSGTMQADAVTLYWLNPVPPIEQGQATLNFVSPDIIDFAFTSGRQGTLKLGGGLVRISGLAQRDQVAEISADIAGPLAEVITLLRHPRLRLLDKRPIEMRDPAGQVTGRLEINALPLESWLTVEDVHLRATAKLAGVHLGGIAAGRDLDQGTLDLTASNEGLKVTGTATLAGIQAKLGVDMDFRTGPPAQIVQSVTVAATPDPAQLAAAGIDLGGVIQGGAPANLVWRARRDGKSDIAITADLTPTKLAITDLGFLKAIGRPARAEIKLQLDRDRITAIDRLIVQGEGIDADARITFAAGKPSQAQITRLKLGAETDLRAEIAYPVRDGAPWHVTLSGTSIDAAAQLRRTPTPATAGPAYVLDAKLDRVSLGPGRRMSAVALHAENDGRINRALHLTGRAGAPFAIDVAPSPGGPGGPGGRTLTGTAADAGALLHALDLVDDMQGGEMAITGRYDDSRPDHRLAGNATITDFRMTKTPGLAKLLQAMTFYGLVELVRGPGLGFSDYTC